MTVLAVALLALAAVADPVVHLVALSAAYGVRHQRSRPRWHRPERWRRWHRWRHTNRPVRAARHAELEEEDTAAFFARLNSELAPRRRSRAL